jgi:hypothetical protein
MASAPFTRTTSGSVHGFGACRDRFSLLQCYSRQMWMLKVWSLYGGRISPHEFGSVGWRCARRKRKKPVMSSHSSLITMNLLPSATVINVIERNAEGLHIAGFFIELQL